MDKSKIVPEIRRYVVCDLQAPMMLRTCPNSEGKVSNWKVSEGKVSEGVVSEEIVYEGKVSFFSNSGIKSRG